MNVIITGSTGMVGKGVLLECLEHPKVDKVLVVNRNPIEMQHSKLKEVLLDDFSDPSSLEVVFKDYDACFYCMGVSSVGMSEEKFNHITYVMTSAFAKVCYTANRNMVFNYVSGTGTDSTEQGGVMWARVKGKTENFILNLGFKDAYAFRPGMILPEKGIRSRTGWYNALYVVFKPFNPLLRKLSSVTTTTKVGLAMIATVLYPQKLKHLENRDINHLANL